jgi:hypothetical protein
MFAICCFVLWICNRSNKSPISVSLLQNIYKNVALLWIYPNKQTRQAVGGTERQRHRHREHRGVEMIQHNPLVSGILLRTRGRQGPHLNMVHQHLRGGLLAMAAILITDLQRDCAERTAGKPDSQLLLIRAKLRAMTLYTMFMIFLQSLKKIGNFPAHLVACHISVQRRVLFTLAAVQRM